ncbi:peptidase S51 [Luteimicrobium subarcticum]|uniref:Cyanophycinase n=1 Tax=Luteimicrobium subarcticum TaxID=620910 RepID=A0A2M8WV80_9MICO|nr:peptidase S51 [Luteimicrobium subarcticum]PJI94796.1 cyanophycinase [Luteimicrobium subarcticum]
MSVHLVGGGWADGPAPEVYGRFRAEAAAATERRSGKGAPRVLVVAIRDGDQDDHAAKLVAALSRAGDVEPVVVALAEGDDVPVETFAGTGADDLDGVVVGGGLTPAYRDALVPHADAIRALVSRGLPYLGFSAGSAIAADHALVGGWRIGDVEVCPEDSSEDLDDVTVLPGLGLVDVAVDVHAAQWGTLTRLVAATEAGLVPGGVAIDESTVLVVGTGSLVVAGAGSVWRVIPGADGDAVQVSSLRA